MNLKIIIGILGILIGILGGTYIQTEYNIIYHGPDSNEIKKQIYRCPETGKYYKFVPIPYVCPPSFSL